MAATVHRLPLPEPDSGRSVGSNQSSASGARPIPGWESTVGQPKEQQQQQKGSGEGINGKFTFDDDPACSSNGIDARRSNSVSSHAISHGSSVLGVRQQSFDKFDGNEDNDNDEEKISHLMTTSSISSSSTRSSSNEEHDGPDPKSCQWIRWETSFAPHRVCRVASNAEGSVVVASTAGGTVSLMRGCDGGVLATRRVYDVDEDAITAPPAEISFVAGAARHNSVVGDVLAIVVPPRDTDPIHHPSNVDEFGNPLPGEKAATTTTSSDETGVPFVNIILVSGIDGSSLNSTSSSDVASAARNMSIDALELSLPLGSNNHLDDGCDISVVGGENLLKLDNEEHIDTSPTVTSLGACFVDHRTIRFLVLDSRGTLSVHDFDVQTKKATPLSDATQSIDTSLRSQNGEKWDVDESVGICVDDMNDIFLLSATQTSSAKVCFYDVNDLSLMSSYVIERSSSSSRDCPKVYAVAPVKSCDRAVAAAAIAVKPSMKYCRAFIEVVQFIVPSKCGSDVTAPRSLPHLIFKIPVIPELEQDIRWIDVAPRVEANGRGKAYSFQYKISHNSGIGECLAFVGDDKEIAGKFRFLLAKGDFDAADMILASPESALATSCQYGPIHGSEVALKRFLGILDKRENIVSLENLAEAKDCFRRLSAGAVTAGDLGLRCLLSASNALLNWPSSMFDGESSSMSYKDTGSEEPIVLAQDYRIALCAMSSTISGASKAASPSHVKSLQSVKVRLDAKILAVRCLELVASAVSSQAVLTPLLAEASSPADVFNFLVGQHAWMAAERLLLSDFGESIFPEYMASAIVNLSHQADPLRYCTWLEQIIIPGLSINHPLLAAIRFWACQTADSLDEVDKDGAGLDSAITLLSAVATATARLSSTTRTKHILSVSLNKTSKISHDSKSLLDKSSTLNDSSVSSSEPGDSFMPSICRPPAPTVMQISFLRGAERQKGSTSFTARRINKQGNSTNTDDSIAVGIDSSQCIRETFRQYSKFEDSEMDTEDVEKKLKYAVSLKQAREQGLLKSIVSLRNYEGMGDATFVAKELVCCILAHAPDDLESEVKRKIEPFCHQAGINFNNVLSEFTKELCDKYKNNPRVLLEAASLCRFCTGSARCGVALKIIRAALRCNELPPALSNLSTEAMEWAVDDEVRTELEEATRLLVVDRIVRRYCGNGAQEMFRVSDPRHGLRLLHFVCRHIDGESTLQDAFALCDAFTHLSKADACVLILKRMALTESQDTSVIRSDQCAAFLRRLYKIDAALAETVGEETCIYLADTIQECSPAMGMTSSHSEGQRRNANAAAKAAISILSVMHEKSSKLGQLYSMAMSKSMTKVGARNCQQLAQKFESICELQSAFSIYLSLSDLEDDTMRMDVCRILLKPAVDLLATTTSEVNYDEAALSENLAHAKRGIGILFGDSHEMAALYWCRAIKEQASRLALTSTDDSISFLFLFASGILDIALADHSFDTVYAAVAAYCIRASKEASGSTASAVDIQSDNTEMVGLNNESVFIAMRSIIRASSILEDHALQFCPERLLGPLVSLTGLIDTVSEVLMRGDGDCGEALDTLRTKLNKLSRAHRLCPSRTTNKYAEAPRTKDASLEGQSLPITPPLHADWYIGDGLLLPPFEALMHCMEYCSSYMKFMISSRSNQTSSLLRKENTIFDFLNDRGAHTISMRLRASSSAIELVSTNDLAATASCYEANNSLTNDLDLVSKESKFLAERSLGGSGSGITNGKIDSNLSLVHLLSLPIKAAFKVYRSSLPSAMSKRDFSRVVTLALVGVRAGSGSTSRRGGEASEFSSDVGWTNQDIFVAQCRRLASNGRWWGLLKDFNVTFDPRRFEGADITQTDAYVASLIVPLIANASKTVLSTSAQLVQVLNLSTKFLCAYGLDEKLAAQKFIEFLLSFPVHQNVPDTQFSFDVRYDLNVCEKLVRDALLLLPSPMARAAIIRRALVALESTAGCHQDYDRYAVVVALYLEELKLVLAEKASSGDLRAFQNEYESIDKRQDALLILSAFFKDQPCEARPPFPSLFLPLPIPFETKIEKAAPKFVGILGYESKGSSPGDFDPILPLLRNLTADGGTSSVAALSPLCFSLGLPAGFIHARSLLLRFQKALEIGSPLPSFEGSVRPVINRIKGAKDAAEITEWCALRYSDGTTERLECLTLALSHAMKASSEAEQQARLHKGNDYYTKNERQALDTVKRLSDLKNGLSDRISVEGVFKNECTSDAGSSRHVESILSDLVETVNQKYRSDGAILPPERLVEGILLEASALTAAAVLDDSLLFTMDDFRKVAGAAHRAVNVLADQHSHVDIGGITRRLARRWLVHGDAAASNADEAQSQTTKVDGDSLESSRADNTGPKENGPSGPSTPSRNVIKNDYGDSEDFIMDLNDFGSDGDVWSDDVGSSFVVKETRSKVGPIVADEEPSAFTINGCSRETAERSNSVAALRVAFVMSFANGYHRKSQPCGETVKATSATSQLRRRTPLSTSSKLNRSLSQTTREKTLAGTNGTISSGQGDAVVCHAKELLGIAFASKKNSGSLISERACLSTVSENSTINRSGVSTPLEGSSLMPLADAETISQNANIHSFAMRYRAISTAMILCPQEALDYAIKSEGYGGDHPADVEKCTFASFVAAEAEAMGIHIPSSDLVHLANMSFGSYSRALWRNHGHNASGRLLVLLLELSLRGQTKGSDGSFALSLLSEITQKPLPRSLLQSLELIASNSSAIKSIHSLNSGEAAVQNAVHKVASLILRCMKDNCSLTLQNKQATNDCINTVRRLGTVVKELTPKHLPTFVGTLCRAVSAEAFGHNIELKKEILKVAVAAACSLEEGNDRIDAFVNIMKAGGSQFLVREGVDLFGHHSVAGEETLLGFEAAQKIEDLFHHDVNTALTQWNESKTLAS